MGLDYIREGRSIRASCQKVHFHQLAESFTSCKKDGFFFFFSSMGSILRVFLTATSATVWKGDNK